MKQVWQSERPLFGFRCSSGCKEYKDPTLWSLRIPLKAVSASSPWKSLARRFASHARLHAVCPPAQNGNGSRELCVKGSWCSCRIVGNVFPKQTSMNSVIYSFMSASWGRSASPTFENNEKLLTIHESSERLVVMTSTDDSTQICDVDTLRQVTPLTCRVARVRLSWSFSIS